MTVTNIWLRDIDRVESAVTEGLHLAEKMSMALWSAWGRIYLGWVLDKRSQPGALEAKELLAGYGKSWCWVCRRVAPTAIAGNASFFAGQGIEIPSAAATLMSARSGTCSRGITASDTRLVLAISPLTTSISRQPPVGLGARAT